MSEFDLVWKKDGIAVATSKVIAEKFGKVHRNVLIDIRKLHCSDEFREQNFLLSHYLSPQNKKIPCYNITRDGFSFLAMGFTGKKAGQWKEAYINAFNEMEKEILNPDGMMEQINSAIAVMEKDKAIASKCGSGLATWRKLKANHTKQVDRLIESAQMELGFSKQ